ncbi:hypothetical protein FSP39_007611 [Pinctada imbricata]|uniref:Amidohydrolase/deacetylase family metallohydrolase n=1 Tax=Pinctada imbricata TaxID=66713 RepID=A0AA89C904_PINIB|nr:hypothetical protein FSP39_007611 [Pinctada imbricata]
MAAADWIIRNGRIIDPVNKVDRVGDIAISDGRIQSIESSLQIQSLREFDASGCLVTPGLIDCHVHCYEYATPLGINPDAQCLARGVTTVVDCGSAGCSTFMGFRKYIAERSRTRILCFLHIAAHGLADAGCSAGAPGGEIDSLNSIRVKDCASCVQGNRDIVVGVKVRLSKTIADQGRNEEEAYR